jgi:ribosomal-protein-alanine N-acetyltransferase
VHGTYPELTTDRLHLCLPSEGEVQLFVDYHTANRTFHDAWSPTRTDESFTATFWLAQIRQMRGDYLDRGFALALWLVPRAGERRIIGKVRYSNIVRGPAQFCFLGYDLDESSQGHGYMTEALRAANEFAFSTLNLHRIMANFIPRNERSGAVLKRLGFTFEGYARDYLRINGRWEDHVLTSLTNPNWQP